MPSIELNKLQAVTAPRALSDTDRTLQVPGAPAAANGASNAGAKPGVEIAVDASVETIKPPVDADRVAQIREALRDGSYPLVPTKIADAMIAAQLSFGMKQ